MIQALTHHEETHTHTIAYKNIIKLQH